MVLNRKIIKLCSATYSLFKNLVAPCDVYYVVEGANWSIQHDGECITKNLAGVKSDAITRNRVWGIRHGVIHYGSINLFLGSKPIQRFNANNKIVVTWFHVSPRDERVSRVQDLIPMVDLWHTSCQITKIELVKLGIPRNRLVVVPLGVDLKHFNPSSEEQKRRIRCELGIPEDNFVIGSFQKDGQGWGRGLEPKQIKGPDVFCDVLEKIAEKKKIFVLLTGPARGYVKNRLRLAGIPYKHDYVTHPNELGRYYKALDLYLIASRVEGGPKSLLESMASGVPLVSTHVGMVPDILIDGENGFLVDVEDRCRLAEKALEVLNSPGLRKKFTENGVLTSRQFDWSTIAGLYYEKIYKPLLNRL